MGRILDDIRETVLPPIGRFLAQYADHGSLYVTSETDTAEYVGIIDRDAASTVEWLRKSGFNENALAAYKTIEDTDVSEQASLAWRGPRSELVDGTGEVPGSDPLADRQLHIILFELDGRARTTAVFAHWEYSWTRHPIKHYRGIGIQDRAGARYCRDFLYDTDLDFESPAMQDLLADRR